MVSIWVNWKPGGQEKELPKVNRQGVWKCVKKSGNDLEILHSLELEIKNQVLGDLTNEVDFKSSQIKRES